MSNETITHIASVFPVNPEAWKSNEKIRRKGSIIKEFSLNTTAHGIPGIARSQSIHNRIFWCVSLIIFTGIMCYFITQSMRDYFAYSTQTTVSFIVEWPQAFPAVTICNYSPIRYDRFIGPFLNYTNALNLTNTTDTTNFTIEESSYIRRFLLYKLNRNESLNEFFYPLDSMMMYCNYNGMSCTAANFTWFMSAQYGLCYTFNAKLKDIGQKSIRNNSDNGANGLFELRLYAHQHQYVPYLSKSIGMVIQVHDNVQSPNIEMAAMYLSPGLHHKLGYIKKTSIFLSAPYTECTDKLSLGMQTMFNEYHDTDYGYTQPPCYSACIQAYVYQKCGCGNPFNWIVRSVVLPGTDKPISIPLCDIENPCYVNAASEIMNTASIWGTYCPDCSTECKVSDFTITPTSLLAPPPFLMNDIKRFVESSTIPLPANWSTTWMSEIQSSYVSLEVAYVTTRTEVYSQQAAISAVDLISGVGGHTGLWIGISFLSLMEIAEMIYRLLRTQLHPFWTAVKKKIGI